MKDTILAGTGNSRYLKSSIEASASWADALALLRAGTFPIDLSNLDAGGVTQMGTALTTDTLLKSAVCTALGLTPETATLSDAWEAIIALIATKQDTLTFDSTPQSGSLNPVRSGGIYTELAGKQDVLTFDITPTAGSDNPVTSNGIYEAIEGATTKSTTITIANTDWSGTGPYTATVTVSGYTVTANSRVDISCDYATMNSLTLAGVSTVYIDNTSGTLTAYAVGAKPNTSITVTALIYETQST